VSNRTVNLGLILTSSLVDDIPGVQWDNYNRIKRMQDFFGWLGYSGNIASQYISSDNCSLTIGECVAGWKPLIAQLRQDSSLAIFLGGHGGLTNGEGATLCSNVSELSTRRLMEHIESALTVPSIARLTLFHDSCFSGQVEGFFREYVSRDSNRFRGIVAYASTQERNFSYFNPRENSPEQIVGDAFVSGLFQAQKNWQNKVPTVAQFLRTASDITHQLNSGLTPPITEYPGAKIEDQRPQLFIWPKAAAEVAMILRKYSEQGHIIDFNVVPNADATTVGACFESIRQNSSDTVLMRLLFLDEIFGNGQIFVYGEALDAQRLVAVFGQTEKCGRIPPTIRRFNERDLPNVRLLAALSQVETGEMLRCISDSFRNLYPNAQAPLVLSTGLKTGDVLSKQKHKVPHLAPHDRSVVIVYSDDLERVNTLGCATLLPLFGNR